jgi:hypothetical protein
MGACTVEILYQQYTYAHNGSIRRVHDDLVHETYMAVYSVQSHVYLHTCRWLGLCSLRRLCSSESLRLPFNNSFSGSGDGGSEAQAKCK